MGQANSELPSFSKEGKFASPISLLCLSYQLSLSWRDAHFKSRRPVLVFVGVVQVGAAGGAGIRAWNGGNEAQREIEIVFGLKVAPVEDDFAADDFVGVYSA